MIVKCLKMTLPSKLKRVHLEEGATEGVDAEAIKVEIVEANSEVCVEEGAVQVLALGIITIRRISTATSVGATMMRMISLQSVPTRSRDEAIVRTRSSCVR